MAAATHLELRLADKLAAQLESLLFWHANAFKRRYAARRLAAIVGGAVERGRRLGDRFWRWLDGCSAFVRGRAERVRCADSLKRKISTKISCKQNSDSIKENLQKSTRNIATTGVFLSYIYSVVVERRTRNEKHRVAGGVLAELNTIRRRNTSAVCNLGCVC